MGIAGSVAESRPTTPLVVRKRQCSCTTAASVNRSRLKRSQSCARSLSRAGLWAHPRRPIIVGGERMSARIKETVWAAELASPPSKDQQKRLQTFSATYCPLLERTKVLKIVQSRIMSRRIFSPISIALLFVAISLRAAPTPTPTPKKSFFSNFKPRANPSATVGRTGAAVGRNSHLGVDRSALSPTPKPSPNAKPKSSTSTRKSPVASEKPIKTTKSPTPSSTATPRSTLSPPKEISPEMSSSPAESVSAAPTSAPSPTATSTPKPSPPPLAAETPTPTASPAVSRPTKIELTLTKFQPPRGSPGDRDYQSAQLSYRINVPNRMEYPAINFTVETSGGKLFERVFQLPSGSAFVEPDDRTEHTVALDPAPRTDWADAYGKTERAKFTWSIEGQTSGSTENSVKKSWP